MVKTINSNKMKQLWDNACHKENDYTGCGHFFSTTRISELKGVQFMQFKKNIQDIEKYIGTELVYSCTEDKICGEKGKHLFFLFDKLKCKVEGVIARNLISHLLLGYSNGTNMNTKALSKKALKRAEDLDVVYDCSCKGSATQCPLF